MKRRIGHGLCRLVLIAAAFGLSGCSFNAGYNPAYLTPSVALNLEGKSLVVMTADDAAWNLATKPTSFTGGGTTLTVPLGEITRQIALKVFGAAFKQGADFKTTVEGAQGYRLIVKPKVANFTYAYNQLKNLGLAITPQVQLELHITLVSPSGAVVLDKSYSSGLTEGGAYVISGQPSEKVNQVLHQALFKLMTDAALEAKQLLEKPAA